MNLTETIKAQIDKASWPYRNFLHMGEQVENTDTERIDYSITVDKDNNSVYASGQIGPWGINAHAMLEAFNKLDGDKPQTLRINSGGGSVFTGFAIADLVKERNINTVATGMAASAASLVFLAGKERTVSNNAMLMVHRAWTVAIGNVTDLRRDARLLTQIDEMIQEHISRVTGLDETKVNKMLADETWIRAKKAVELGFATEMEGDDEEDAENSVDTILDLYKQGIYKNPPQDILDIHQAKQFLMEQEEKLQQLAKTPGL